MDPEKRDVPNVHCGVLLFVFMFFFLQVFILVFSYSSYTNSKEAVLLLNQVEHASNSRAAGIFDQLERIEQQVISYTDGMEAIALVLEKNTGYYLYQELGVVVMSHDYYLKKGY